MFAFVVKDINIDKNVQKISALQLKDYKELKVKSPLISSVISSTHDYTFESEYSLDKSDILLFHVFYDFSPIIRK